MLLFQTKRNVYWNNVFINMSCINWKFSSSYYYRVPVILPRPTQTSTSSWLLWSVFCFPAFLTTFPTLISWTLIRQHSRNLLHYFSLVSLTGAHSSRRDFCPEQYSHSDSSGGPGVNIQRCLTNISRLLLGRLEHSFHRVTMFPQVVRNVFSWYGTSCCDQCPHGSCCLSYISWNVMSLHFKDRGAAASMPRREVSSDVYKNTGKSCSWLSATSFLSD